MTSLQKSKPDKKSRLKARKNICIYANSMWPLSELLCQNRFFPAKWSDMKIIKISIFQRTRSDIFLTCKIVGCIFGIFNFLLAKKLRSLYIKATKLFYNLFQLVSLQQFETATVCLKNIIALHKRLPLLTCFQLLIFVD